jgi:hypothetical protein
VQSYRWQDTPLGPVAGWPGSLRTAVSIVLRSVHPMFLWWGEELTQIYNDAYVPCFGVGKHPLALGQGGRECWPEIWSIIGPQIDEVRNGREARWYADNLVPIWRNGRIEDVYWSYTYTPVFNELDEVGGVLVVCSETTARCWPNAASTRWICWAAACRAAATRPTCAPQSPSPPSTIRATC